MKDLKYYCDEIEKILQKIEEKEHSNNCDSHIWNDRQEILEIEDLFPNDISFCDNETTIDEFGEKVPIVSNEELAAEECMMEEALEFTSKDQELGFVGKQCESIRKQYIDEITDRFLSLTQNDRNIYVQNILEQMLYLKQNHTLAKTRVFERVVIPDFFKKLIDFFQSYNTNLNDVLSGFKPLRRGCICSLLGITYTPTTSINKKSAESIKKNCTKQSDNLAFESLFVSESKPHISSFIQKLKDNNIIDEDEIYNRKSKNYLTKLIVYLIYKKCLNIKGLTDISIARCFYKRFGYEVVEYGSRNKEKEITSSNIRKTIGRGWFYLSPKEKKDFDNLCSDLIPVGKKRE